MREGHGTGEGYASSAGEVHDTALKSAETDATKRALATFGLAFSALSCIAARGPRRGRSSYLHRQPARQSLRDQDYTPTTRPQSPGLRTIMAIVSPMKSPTRSARSFVRRKSSSKNELRSSAVLGPLVSPYPRSWRGRKDSPRSALTIAEPKRLRDKAHLKFVATQPCLICGRQPSDAHHLRFAQPRAIGLKVSDEFTVPLCRTHHRQLHDVGNEQAWWASRSIEPLPIARTLWERTHPDLARSDVHLTSQARSPSQMSEDPPPYNKRQILI